MLLPLLWVLFAMYKHYFGTFARDFEFGEIPSKQQQQGKCKIPCLLVKDKQKVCGTIFRLLTLDSSCWWCFETCRKAALMEDWGGEEGLQNNFAKRWNRELGLFSMLGNKVVNSCLGGRSPDQRGDLARNWQTVQRHCKARWQVWEREGYHLAIFALASKLGNVICPSSVKLKSSLKHVRQFSLS